MSFDDQTNPALAGSSFAAVIILEFYPAELLQRHRPCGFERLKVVKSAKRGLTLGIPKT